ncbi:hypothetical protein NC797_07980 [Aquibacillus sp. 3ASR75-11]|uniref:Uncharacterized protein n=1 Tax=Terrihalobacillus insolitus TaxID=2950438 RepID=A0A9X3WUG2_9BACI|nr:hypothetical protein [Terrihalobacillus insolitus]MDC3424446.1 hypothetical protein [Terrihalobacillus insolitus]
MRTYFKVKQDDYWFLVEKETNYPFYCYVDQRLVATIFIGDQYRLNKAWFTPGKHMLTVVTHYPENGKWKTLAEQYGFISYDYSKWNKQGSTSRQRTFRAGDILVASDNLNETTTGYMGHSAIVVDEQNLIESPGGHPAILMDSIEQFLEKHPAHAQFRPRSPELGLKAAQYGREYLAQYEQNLQQGINKPVFSFSLNTSLEDRWEHIYCSKLVWICYYYGANYRFENDYLWFAPEDLYTNLKKNSDFEILYEHPQVGFKINL